MAKLKKKEEVKAPEYRVLVKSPVQIKHRGVWLSVGGEVTLPATPPQVGRVVREPTPAEYIEIAKRNPNLVQIL